MIPKIIATNIKEMASPRRRRRRNHLCCFQCAHCEHFFAIRLGMKYEARNMKADKSYQWQTKKCLKCDSSCCVFSSSSLIAFVVVAVCLLLRKPRFINILAEWNG